MCIYNFRKKSYYSSDNIYIFFQNKTNILFGEFLITNVIENSSWNNMRNIRKSCGYRN